VQCIKLTSILRTLENPLAYFFNPDAVDVFMLFIHRCFECLMTLLLTFIQSLCCLLMMMAFLLSTSSLRSRVEAS